MRRSIYAYKMFFAVSIVVALAGMHQAFTQERTGGLEGRVVFADKTGVEKAAVKIVDKLEVFKAPTSAQPFLTVQQIAIAKDANLRETSTDRQGRFKFAGLPSGKYYIIFKVLGAFEGDDWIYQYHKPANVYYLAGHMEKPDEYTVKPGEVATIADIEIIRRLEATLPSKLPDKDGFYRFTWSRHEIEGFFRLTLKHQDYHGNLQHSSYQAQEVKEPSYANGEALLPGRHRFQVEQLVGKTLRAYARSPWVEFTVPGEVLKLTVEKDDRDPTGRTISWRGSDAIKAVKIASTGGGYDALITNRTVQLPAAPGKRFELRACNEKGKELIPGWLLFYLQPESKEGK